MTVATISGIRGIFNGDLLPADIVAYARNFSSLTTSPEVLIGRDTRSTGELMERLAKGALVSMGMGVVDYGVISTPALFRESRLKQRAAMMITASHNEPEWNGIKFVLDGRGVVQSEFDRILQPRRRGVQKVWAGLVRPGPRPSYGSELIGMAGEGSCDGVKVAVDLNGGAAIAHTPAILKALGCDLTVLGGTAGVFSRNVDPTNDDLQLLTRTVREKGCDVGFAFDCDGDRLVLVDSIGRKRTGDYMLTLAIKEILPELQNRSVVVSADTTQAIDDVVSELGGRTYRSKVGEANVISKMMEEHIGIGGEGSSGGLVDGSFNFCRDSMLAAITIVKAIKKKGSRVLDQAPSYHQVRLKLTFERKKALAAIKKLQRENPGADMLDGIKVNVSRRSWVLIRASGTEDIIRVSAESASVKEAQQLADSYLERLKRLS
ncbi:MAG: phosphomannomutase [Thaumarchaeota archaeon]|nr:phosphomannomutase [Nitrososphaerota archaeon]